MVPRSYLLPFTVPVSVNSYPSPAVLDHLFLLPISNFSPLPYTQLLFIPFSSISAHVLLFSNEGGDAANGVEEW